MDYTKTLIFIEDGEFDRIILSIFHNICFRARLLEAKIQQMIWKISFSDLDILKQSNATSLSVGPITELTGLSWSALGVMEPIVGS